ncbi:MAG TPA: double zinc ribbon domain-containing protein [Candidatus Nanoarchaeia archaeon]
MIAVMGWLDFLFPKTCVGCGAFENYLCEDCEGKVQYLERQFCPQCSRPAIDGRTHPACRRPLGLDGLVSLTFFSFPVNKLIYSFKYRYTTNLLSEIAGKITLDKNLVRPLVGGLVPIPLYWQRENDRGFNQSELLGTIYAEKLGLQAENNLLKRLVKTKSQVGLKRQDRQANVKGVFALTRQVHDQNFVVFDDVWTSGATLKNATQVLKRNGAGSVWGLTLARSR